MDITKEELENIIKEELEAVLDEKRKKKSKRKKAGTESSKESSLRDWFGRKGAKGKKKGWVDCNAPDGKGGYKSCGRASGEKRKKYPLNCNLKIEPLTETDSQPSKNSMESIF